MTKNQIIQELFLSKNFNDCINKMHPEYLRKDLKSEVILKMCELDDNKVLGLHERGELNFYVARTIITTLSNPTNKFYKYFRQQDVEYTEIEGEIKYKHVEELHSLSEREEKEMLEDLNNEKLQQYLSELDWYELELIKLYKQFGNYRAINKDTGIPVMSIYSTIKKAFEKIRCKMLK